jgi:hypothetical protein
VRAALIYYLCVKLPDSTFESAAVLGFILHLHEEVRQLLEPPLVAPFLQKLRPVRFSLLASTCAAHALIDSPKPSRSRREADAVSVVGGERVLQGSLPLLLLLHSC